MKLICSERYYLKTELERLNFIVFESNANYLFFKSEMIDLKEQLVLKNILIRDCSNYVGLDKGFYRIAVKSHEDNMMLIDSLRKLHKKEQIT